MKGMIYFAQVQPNGPIKIGWTTNLVMRLINIRCHCPYPVEIVGVIAAGIDVESAVHAMFSDDLMHGEWFNPSRGLIEYIGSNASHWKSSKPKGENHHNAALSEAVIPEIRRLATEGVHPTAIATRYGVSPNTIKSVIAGRSWKHVAC